MVDRDMLTALKRLYRRQKVGGLGKSKVLGSEFENGVWHGHIDVRNMAVVMSEANQKLWRADE
jgi:hypothetical protein